MPETDYEVVVLGGGHNGLVAACYLAAAGLRTLVLERREILGGACVTEELFPGYRFSTCSYLCHLFQDKVIDDLELRNHGFRVYPIDPSRFLPMPDGSRLLIWNDDARTQAEIGRFSKRDAESYPRWNQFWRRAAGLIHPYFLTAPPTIGQIASTLRGPDDEAFLDRLLTTSMKDVVTEFFESNPVRAAFIHAHDVGDVTAPGSAWCYAYIKCSMLAKPENVGLVHGGMGGITKALAAAATSRGATLRVSADVDRILIRHGTAIGVKLRDGTEIRSRLVLSNADPKRTFLKLIRAEDLPPGFDIRVKRLKTNAAYFKFHAALTGVPDFSRYYQDGNPPFDPRFLAEVKICPSIEYFEQAWRDALNGEPSRNLVMEVQMPSAYDTTVAPPGHHVLSVWGLYAPTRLRHGTWDERREEVGQRLIDTLSAYAPHLRHLIHAWSLSTPADLESRVGLTDGNIRHIDMIPSQFLAQRPLGGWAHYRTPIANLYLCGAGTHPGGEVTGAPGHNAAQMILTDG